MKLEIDIISKEVVNPSSPTPKHLKHYNLSFIDQTRISLLMPHVLYYPSDQDSLNVSEKSNHLKKSLSQALALYYPLAGRLVVDNSYVDCNDEGVTFVVAEAKCKVLNDVILDPIPEELNKFLPCEPDYETDHCLVVQATFFSCGGLALGLGISHKVADAFSYFMFVNTWAAISRQDNNLIQPPIFEGARLFPPKLVLAPAPTTAKKTENIVTKRFVFNAEKIANLKDKYTKDTSKEGLTSVTRIEALTAFIWTRFMAATGAKDDTSKVYALKMIVNIRTKVVPPLSEFHFGNIFLSTTTIPSLENDDDGMVMIIRDAISNIDRDYVAKIREGNESMDTIITNGRKMPQGEMTMFTFSSLCRLPLHKADFGWGIPVLVGSAKLPLSNLVIFMDSLSKGGIDAWVNLKEEDMVRFEVDEELLEYVSPPS